MGRKKGLTSLSLHTISEKTTHQTQQEENKSKNGLSYMAAKAELMDIALYSLVPCQFRQFSLLAPLKSAGKLKNFHDWSVHAQSQCMTAE